MLFVESLKIVRAKPGPAEQLCVCVLVWLMSTRAAQLIYSLDSVSVSVEIFNFNKLIYLIGKFVDRSNAMIRCFIFFLFSIYVNEGPIISAHTIKLFFVLFCKFLINHEINIKNKSI